MAASIAWIRIAKASLSARLLHLSASSPCSFVLTIISISARMAQDSMSIIR